MENNKQNKSKNSFAKSLNYILRQAANGSKVHIAMIAGSVLTVILVAALVLMGIFGGEKPVENEIDNRYDKNREALDVEQLGNTILARTEDAGQEYVDSTMFIGDSNTVRSMAYGHTTWDNVVAAVSMGVQHITSLEMTYFEGYANPVTVPEAVKIIQPQRIIITYGTNNTVGYSVDNFISMYKEGLDAIHEAYPYADIIINAIPPIDKERENLTVTMQTIDKFNKALSEMAQEEGYKFLNSSEALKDEDTGFAKKDYTIGDGIHLSKLGMDALFEYIRTHAYITEDTRPKPLKEVPERKETPTGIITEDPLAVRGTKIRILFQSSDTSLGTVDGEIEQKIKRTITSQAVTAVPNVAEGGYFTGWSCNYEGLSSSDSTKVTFTVPQVDDSVTDIYITANFAKAGVTIKKDGRQTNSVTLENGKSVKLSADVTDKFTGDKTVTWQSDDSSIAKVSSDGTVTAVSGGTTQIYASILGGKIYASCTVTVTRKLEGLSLSGNTSLKVGDTSRLTLSVKPIGASVDKNNAVWKSSDESVAQVSRNGTVTAKKEGSAVITVSLEGFSAQITINVTHPKPLQGITISGPTQVTEGTNIQLSVSYNPSDTTDDRTAKWSSDNTAVATVVDGTVIGVAPGTATITCTVGSHTATVTITVIKDESAVVPTPSPSPTPSPTPSPSPSAEPPASQPQTGGEQRQ